MSAMQLQVMQTREESTGPFAHQLLQLAKLHFNPEASACSSPQLNPSMHVQSLCFRQAAMRAGDLH